MSNRSDGTSTSALCAEVEVLKESVGVSLDCIADCMGVSRQTLWYWKRGRTSPSARGLSAAWDALRAMQVVGASFSWRELRASVGPGKARDESFRKLLAQARSVAPPVGLAGEQATA